jgi:hypothetical protein
MRFQKFFEFQKKDLEPIKSFYLKDELNPKIWTDFDIDLEIREKLLQIAQDFYNSTELEADIKDIILTGSLANYNWSEKYSDYDLHILIDFRDIDDNVVLVKKFTDSIKSLWNQTHNIKISNYEVEVYLQDVSEVHKSSGVFSLMKNKWKIKPSKVNFEPDEEEIEEKAGLLMSSIDDIESRAEEDSYEVLKDKISVIWKKIKNKRKSGLEEGGEFSTGNLVFKLLRRNGYLEKIMNLKRTSYDKQFESVYLPNRSIDLNNAKYWDFSKQDVEDLFLPITDELIDQVIISVNYVNKNLAKIVFYLDPEYQLSMGGDIHSDAISNIFETMEGNLNLQFFKNLGYNVRCSKRTGFIWNRRERNGGVDVGPWIYSIELEKGKINEWYDDVILELLYELDRMSEKLDKESYEGCSKYLNYEFFEDRKKIALEFGSNGYSDGFSEEWVIDYSDISEIVVSMDENWYSGEGGSGEDKRIKKFDSFYELIKEIKENF